MTVTTIFPCDNCICVPICRHKLYSKLYDDCSLLSDYIKVKIKDDRKIDLCVVSMINRKTIYFENLLQLQTHLKPTAWEVDAEGILIALRKDNKL